MTKMKSMDRFALDPLKSLAPIGQKKRYGRDLQDQSFNRWYDNAHMNDEGDANRHDENKEEIIVPKPKMRMDTLIQATTPLDLRHLSEAKDVRSNDMRVYAAQLRHKLDSIKEEQYAFSFMNRQMTKQQRDVYSSKKSR